MSAEAYELYLRDGSRRGPEPDGAFSGAAGGAVCGDVVRISLRIEDGAVAEATFAAEGCGAIRAAAAAAADLAEGRSVLDVARIGADDLDEALGGLTPANRHGPAFAADALHRALAGAAASGVRLAPEHGRRVLVAMSGGVDSAVAGLIERERGADVVAVTLKLWADPETDGTKACCSPEAVIGARRLAHSLGMPHFTLDLEEAFRREVVDRFVAGYAAGETPNPCVLCNGDLRIEAMAELAGRLGAQRLVTGHYARVIDDGQGPLLAPASDPAKDQTYMLAGLPPRVLGRLTFPLADMRKAEVRALAEEHGLTVARKPESQDLCFLAGRGKRGFLRTHGGIEDREGPIVDRRGRTLARHRGHHHFTVGQRRGIGVATGDPLYVLGTDATSNTVTVGVREELETSTVRVRNAVLHRDGATVDAVRLRYHAPEVGAEVAAAPAPGRHAELELRLATPFPGAAPGQTAVLSSKGAIVGHGVIA